MTHAGLGKDIWTGYPLITAGNKNHRRGAETTKGEVTKTVPAPGNYLKKVRA